MTFLVFEKTNFMYLMMILSSIVSVLFGSLGVDLFVFLMFIISFFFTAKKKQVFFLCYVFYLLFQMSTDVYNEIYFYDIQRNVVRLTSIFVVAGVIYSGTDRFNSIFIIFVLIVSLFGDLQQVIQLGEYDANAVWRHGIGEPLSLLVISLSAYFWRNYRWFLVFVLMLLLVVNYYLDFRTISLFCFLLVFILNYDYFKKLDFVTKYIVVFSAILVFCFLFVFYLEDSSNNSRRGTSDMVRSAMTLTAISDLLDFNILGHGYGAFQRDFVIPDLNNIGLEQSIDGVLPMHGYIWLISYEMGWVGFLSMLLVFLVLMRELVSNGPVVVKIFLVYFMLGSFLLALAEFDRYVVGVALGVFLKFSSNNFFSKVARC